ncbi:T9SS type B sorting domain-containing protein [Thalassobellus citreus]|uniref:T9SS type B sorting domain-containing protein n=1 Tax=Thalassobellus citreus TaxID=3367752 RepID=UPI0037B19861
MGQKQAANWYFGLGAGLNFNTEPPTVLNNSKLFTFEGCATISNKKGKLLFYTDGITVYNKLHRQMSNGYGLFGDSSSSQSAIIVPKPDNEDIYYIFTVGSALNGRGLNYSIVDMTLDDGNGDIISDKKNIPLLHNASEKITAVKHLDGESIWIITFNNSTAYSYKVSTTGVSRKSVKSEIREFIDDTRGYLKASPNGEYLAMANVNNDSFLLPFFAGSGKVFPGLKLEFESDTEKAYGMEFSAESQKLYVDTYTEITSDDETTKFNRFLYQFDLNAPNIQNSRILIDSRKDFYRGALQLAINGKIYRALSSEYEVGSEYLGVIHKPELKGNSSNYQHNAVNINSSFKTALSTQGLPPFIQSLFFFTINVKNPCINKVAEFSLNTIEENYSVIWDFGDKTTSTEINPSHQYTSAGSYFVSANMKLENGDTKTISKIIQIFDVPNLISGITLEQCDNDNDGIGNFNLNEVYDLVINSTEEYTINFYESLKDIDTENTIDTSIPFQNLNSNPQELWLKATNEIGCSEIANFYIYANNANLGPIDNFVVCDYNDGVEDDGFGLFNLVNKEIDIRNQFSLDSSIKIAFYLTELEAELESNPIEDEELISQNKIIWVRAESENQECKGIESLQLIVNKLPNPNLNREYYICLNKINIPVQITANSIYDSYEWRNEDTDVIFETNQLVNIYNIGNYSLTSSYTENGIQCFRKELFSVKPSNIATIEQPIKVIDATQNNIITVLVSGEGTYEYQLLNEDNTTVFVPYQESNVFDNVAPGIYTVWVKDVKNDCGTVTDKVSVIGFPKVFTPNGDGYNDTWQVTGVSNMFQPNTKILIYNRLGKLLKELSPLGKGWNGLFNGEVLPSDDYWFYVTLQDGRIFKNHFSLKH